jgi:hypothetical protein
MSQQGIKTKPDTKAERELYERQAKEKELRDRERRLQEHKRYLNEQMELRKDYYSLGLLHKAIILVMFLTLSSFVAFLVLSYFPPTKDIVHNFIQKLL